MPILNRCCLAFAMGLTIAATGGSPVRAQPPETQPSETQPLGVGAGDAPTSTVPAWSFPYEAQPEPFRGEDGEIDGRRFRYASDGFLQRFSFALSPLARSNRPRRVGEEGSVDPGGESAERPIPRALSGLVFRGTAGSISSDEFYSEQELFWRPRLDDRFFFDLRYQRQEDFDSRYDRVLTGLGVEWAPGWSTTILSEVVAEKPGIDVQLESAWRRESTGEYVRAALVLVDVANAKSDEFEYEDDPYTVFLDGRWSVSESLTVATWGNYNARLRRSEFVDGNEGGFDFVYDQVSAGGRLEFRLSDEWRLGQSVEGLFSQRSRRVDLNSGASLTTEQRFSRRHVTARTSLRRDWGDGQRFEAGLRYFKLSERDRRPFDEVNSIDLIRRETIVDVGMTWRLSPRVAFAPTLFLAMTDNEEQAPYDPSGIDDRDEDFLAKINPIFFITFESGTIAINPSFLLHEPKFGGGNVQIELRF